MFEERSLRQVHAVPPGLLIEFSLIVVSLQRYRYQVCILDGAHYMRIFQMTFRETPLGTEVLREHTPENTEKTLGIGNRTRRVLGGGSVVLLRLRVGVSRLV